MSSYPSYASFFSRSYSNVSHQNFLVEPAASGTLSSHRQMTFRLPSNANIHMDKTRLLFCLNTAGGTHTIGRLASAKAIIDRITIDMGGVSISSGVASHSALQQCLDNMRVIEEDPVLSHSEYLRITVGSGAALVPTATETYSATGNTQYFSIDLGPFFKTLQPNLFPLSIVPSTEVTIFLSGDATVVSSVKGANPLVLTADLDAGSTQPTYTVDNYRLLVSAYSIDDGVFSEVISTRLNSEDGLDAMFCDYQGFSDTYDGSTRVSSAASSLDRVIVAFRPNQASSGHGGAEASQAFNGVRTPVPVVGRNNGLETGTAVAGVFDYASCFGGAKFLNANLNFRAPVDDTNLTDLANMPSVSISINNIRFPSFDAKLGAQSYELLKEAFEVDNTQSQSLGEYLANRCMVATKLNLPGSQQLRARSGLNLQGSNSTILVQNVGATGNAVNTSNVLVFLESTCMLKIMPGKQLQVTR